MSVVAAIQKTIIDLGKGATGEITMNLRTPAEGVFRHAGVETRWYQSCFANRSPASKKCHTALIDF